MSDRSKKLDEELQLRLLAITEDPTFRGGQDQDNKGLPVVMIDVDSEQLHENGTHRILTIH